MQKTYSPKLKSISTILAFTFLISDVSYAAPALPFTPKDIIQNPALLQIPEGFAKFREVHKGQNKLIVHIQDAHTNPSAQKNIAKTLETLIQKHGLKTVFLEGGTKDDSLIFLRPLADTKTRERVANKFLLQGELNGAEYLNLSTEFDFKLLGVEDGKLYQKNLSHYSKLFQQRECVLAYIEEAEKAVKTLKYALFPKELMQLDETIQKFEKKDKNFTEYHALLSGQAEKTDINLLGYPNFLALKEIKSKEDKINFEKANKEQEELVNEYTSERVSEYDPAHPHTRTPANQSTPLQRLKSDGVTPLPLYEEILKQATSQKIDLKKFPNLLLYVDYLKSYSSLDLEKFFKEIKAIEEEIYNQTLADNKDALYLHAIDNHIKLVKKLFTLQSSSDEFAQYQQNKKDISFETIVYLAFLNKTLYDLGRYSEVVRYLPLIDDNRTEAEDFYQTNEQRDKVFLQKALNAMNHQDIKMAVLITGGYHTENLKGLMKKEGISYAVVTPLISEETNIPRYEGRLLGQLGKDCPIKKTVTTNTDSLNVAPDAEQMNLGHLIIVASALNENGFKVISEGDIMKAASSEELAATIGKDILSFRARVAGEKSRLRPAAARLAANQRFKEATPKDIQPLVSPKDVQQLGKGGATSEYKPAPVTKAPEPGDKGQAARLAGESGVRSPELGGRTTPNAQLLTPNSAPTAPLAARLAGNDDAIDSLETMASLHGGYRFVNHTSPAFNRLIDWLRENIKGNLATDLEAPSEIIDAFIKMSLPANDEIALLSAENAADRQKASSIIRQALGDLRLKKEAADREFDDSLTDPAGARLAALIDYHIRNLIDGLPVEIHPSSEAYSRIERIESVKIVHDSSLSRSRNEKSYQIELLTRGENEPSGPISLSVRYNPSIEFNPGEFYSDLIDTFDSSGLLWLAGFSLRGRVLSRRGLEFVKAISRLNKTRSARTPHWQSEWEDLAASARLATVDREQAESVVRNLIGLLSAELLARFPTYVEVEEAILTGKKGVFDVKTAKTISAVLENSIFPNLNIRFSNAQDRFNFIKMVGDLLAEEEKLYSLAHQASDDAERSLQTFEEAVAQTQSSEVIRLTIERIDGRKIPNFYARGRQILATRLEQLSAMNLEQLKKEIRSRIPVGLHLDKFSVFVEYEDISTGLKPSSIDSLLTTLGMTVLPADGKFVLKGLDIDGQQHTISVFIRPAARLAAEIQTTHRAGARGILTVHVDNSVTEERQRNIHITTEDRHLDLFQRIQVRNDKLKNQAIAREIAGALDLKGPFSESTIREIAKQALDYVAYKLDFDLLDSPAMPSATEKADASEIGGSTTFGPPDADAARLAGRGVSRAEVPQAAAALLATVPSGFKPNGVLEDRTGNEINKIYGLELAPTKGHGVMDVGVVAGRPPVPFGTEHKPSAKLSQQSLHSLDSLMVQSKAAQFSVDFLSGQIVVREIASARLAEVDKLESRINLFLATHRIGTRIKITADPKIRSLEIPGSANAHELQVIVNPERVGERDFQIGLGRLLYDLLSLGDVPGLENKPATVEQILSGQTAAPAASARLAIRRGFVKPEGQPDDLFTNTYVSYRVAPLFKKTPSVIPDAIVNAIRAHLELEMAQGHIKSFLVNDFGGTDIDIHVTHQFGELNADVHRVMLEALRAGLKTKKASILLKENIDLDDLAALAQAINPVPKDYSITERRAESVGIAKIIGGSAGAVNIKTWHEFGIPGSTPLQKLGLSKAPGFVFVLRKAEDIMNGNLNGKEWRFEISHEHVLVKDKKGKITPRLRVEDGDTLIKHYPSKNQSIPLLALLSQTNDYWVTAVYPAEGGGLPADQPLASVVYQPVFTTGGKRVMNPTIFYRLQSGGDAVGGAGSIVEDVNFVPGGPEGKNFVATKPVSLQKARQAPPEGIAHVVYYGYQSHLNGRIPMETVVDHVGVNPPALEFEQKLATSLARVMKDHQHDQPFVAPFAAEEDVESVREAQDGFFVHSPKESEPDEFLEEVEARVQKGELVSAADDKADMGGTWGHTQVPVWMSAVYKATMLEAQEKGELTFGNTFGSVDYERLKDDENWGVGDDGHMFMLGDKSTGGFNSHQLSFLAFTRAYLFSSANKMKPYGEGQDFQGAEAKAATDNPYFYSKFTPRFFELLREIMPPKYLNMITDIGDDKGPVNIVDRVETAWGEWEKTGKSEQTLAEPFSGNVSQQGIGSARYFISPKTENTIEVLAGDKMGPAALNRIIREAVFEAADSDAFPEGLVFEIWDAKAFVHEGFDQEGSPILKIALKDIPPSLADVKLLAFKTDEDKKYILGLYQSGELASGLKVAEETKLTEILKKSGYVPAKRIFLDAKEDREAIIKYLADSDRFNVKHVWGKKQGGWDIKNPKVYLNRPVLASSITRLGILTGGEYVGKDDPVMVGHSKLMHFVGQFLKTRPIIIQGDMNGSHWLWAVPTTLKYGVATKDSHPVFVMLRYHLSEDGTKFERVEDLTGEPSFRAIRRQAFRFNWFFKKAQLGGQIEPYGTNVRTVEGSYDLAKILKELNRADSPYLSTPTKIEQVLSEGGIWPVMPEASLRELYQEVTGARLAETEKTIADRGIAGSRTDAQSAIRDLPSANLSSGAAASAARLATQAPSGRPEDQPPMLAEETTKTQNFPPQTKETITFKGRTSTYDTVLNKPDFLKGGGYNVAARLAISANIAAWAQRMFQLGHVLSIDLPTLADLEDRFLDELIKNRIVYSATTNNNGNLGLLKEMQARAKAKDQPDPVEAEVRAILDSDAALSAPERKNEVLWMAYENLINRFVAKLAVAFLPIYEETNGRHGFVSTELPTAVVMGDDIQKIIDTGIQRFKATQVEIAKINGGVATRNIFLKIPATDLGLKAGRRLEALGYNVNYTLVATKLQYVRTALAHQEGIKEFVKAYRSKHGRMPSVKELPQSVSSDFVSRDDRNVAPILEDESFGKMIEHLTAVLAQTEKEGNRIDALAIQQRLKQYEKLAGEAAASKVKAQFQRLRGESPTRVKNTTKVAVAFAQAEIATAWRDLFETDSEWQDFLRDSGLDNSSASQQIYWASTGVKDGAKYTTNPFYLGSLIWAHTTDTVPRDVIEAIARLEKAPFVPRAFNEDDIRASIDILRELMSLGVDLRHIKQHVIFPGGLKDFDGSDKDSIKLLGDVYDKVAAARLGARQLLAAGVTAASLLAAPGASPATAQKPTAAEDKQAEKVSRFLAEGLYGVSGTEDFRSWFKKFSAGKGQPNSNLDRVKKMELALYPRSEALAKGFNVRVIIKMKRGDEAGEKAFDVAIREKDKDLATQKKTVENKAAKTRREVEVPVYRLSFDRARLLEIAREIFDDETIKLSEAQITEVHAQEGGHVNDGDNSEKFDIEKQGESVLVGDGVPVILFSSEAARLAFTKKQVIEYLADALKKETDVRRIYIEFNGGRAPEITKRQLWRKLDVFLRSGNQYDVQVDVTAGEPVEIKINTKPDSGIRGDARDLLPLIQSGPDDGARLAAKARWADPKNRQAFIDYYQGSGPKESTPLSGLRTKISNPGDLAIALVILLRLDYQDESFAEELSTNLVVLGHNAIEALNDAIASSEAASDIDDGNYRDFYEIVIRTLGSIGPPAAKKAESTLVKLAKRNDDPDFMEVLAYGFAGIFSDDIPHLIKLLGVKGEHLKETIIIAIGLNGPKSKQAVPALMALLDPKIGWNSDLKSQYWSAIEALGKIGPDAEEAAPVLIESLANPELQDLAQKALAKMGPSVLPDLIPVLTQYDDPSQDFVGAAIQQMGKEALPGLYKALSDPDHSVFASQQIKKTIQAIESASATSSEPLAPSRSPATPTYTPIGGDRNHPTDGPIAARLALSEENLGHIREKLAAVNAELKGLEQALFKTGATVSIEQLAQSPLVEQTIREVYDLRAEKTRLQQELASGVSARRGTIEFQLGALDTQIGRLRQSLGQAARSTSISQLSQSEAANQTLQILYKALAEKAELEAQLAVLTAASSITPASARLAAPVTEMLDRIERSTADDIDALKILQGLVKDPNGWNTLDDQAKAVLGAFFRDAEIWDIQGRVMNATQGTSPDATTSNRTIVFQAIGRQLSILVKPVGLVGVNGHIQNLRDRAQRLDADEREFISLDGATDRSLIEIRNQKSKLQAEISSLKTSINDPAAPARLASGRRLAGVLDLRGGTVNEDTARYERSVAEFLRMDVRTVSERVSFIQSQLPPGSLMNRGFVVASPDRDTALIVSTYRVPPSQDRGLIVANLLNEQPTNLVPQSPISGPVLAYDAVWPFVMVQVKPLNTRDQSLYIFRMSAEGVSPVSLTDFLLTQENLLGGVSSEVSQQALLPAVADEISRGFQSFKLDRGSRALTLNYKTAGQSENIAIDLVRAAQELAETAPVASRLAQSAQPEALPERLRVPSLSSRASEASVAISATGGARLANLGTQLEEARLSLQSEWVTVNNTLIGAGQVKKGELDRIERLIKHATFLLGDLKQRPYSTEMVETVKNFLEGLRLIKSLENIVAQQKTLRLAAAYEKYNQILETKAALFAESLRNFPEDKATIESARNLVESFGVGARLAENAKIASPRHEGGTRNDKEIKTIASRLAASVPMPQSGVFEAPFEMAEKIFDFTLVRTANAAEVRVTTQIINNPRGITDRTTLSVETVNIHQVRSERTAKTIAEQAIKQAFVSQTKPTQSIDLQSVIRDLLAREPLLARLPAFSGRGLNTWNGINSGLVAQAGVGTSPGLVTEIILPFTPNQLDLKGSLDALEAIAKARSLPLRVVFTNRGVPLADSDADNIAALSSAYQNRPQPFIQQISLVQVSKNGILSDAIAQQHAKDNVNNDDLAQVVMGISETDLLTVQAQQQDVVGFQQLQQAFGNRFKPFGVTMPQDAAAQLISYGDILQTALASIAFPNLIFPSNISLRVRRVTVLGVELLIVEPVLDKELAATAISRRATSKSA